MDTTTFIKLFRQALDNVSVDYYGTKESNDNAFLGAGVDAQDPRYKALKKFLSRYGERAFCYELYHQIRVLMDEHYKRHPTPKGMVTICLQAELKKEYIRHVIEFFDGVQPLKKEYMPDFLLHSPHPGDFRHQLLIIEVKSDPKLSWSGIKDDLAKIQEFIANYQYQQGIFVTVNTSPEHMRAVLACSPNQDWVREKLPDRSKILFMCKERYGKDTCEWNLGDLPTD